MMKMKEILMLFPKFIFLKEAGSCLIKSRHYIF